MTFQEQVFQFILKDLNIPSSVEVVLVVEQYPYKIKGYCKRITSKYFEIGINSSLKTKDIIDTLSHELRHVYQYYTSMIMRDEGSRVYNWYGKNYYGDKIINPYLIEDYYIGFAPHEVDANLYMKGIRQKIYQEIHKNYLDSRGKL